MTKTILSKLHVFVSRCTCYNLCLSTCGTFILFQGPRPAYKQRLVQLDQRHFQSFAKLDDDFASNLCLFFIIVARLASLSTELRARLLSGKRHSSHFSSHKRQKEHERGKKLE